MVDILMFHRVQPAEQIVRPNAYWDRGTLITTDKLEGVLSGLRERGKRVVPLLELVQRMMEGRPTGELVALTFDDGYADNVQYAAPILREYGCVATFFPVLGPVLANDVLPLDKYYFLLDQMDVSSNARHEMLVGTSKEEFITATRGRQYELLDAMSVAPSSELTIPPLYISMGQLKALVAEGHDLGVHTHWHQLLPFMSEEDVRSELSSGLEHMQAYFGNGPFPLAYPDGRSDDRVRDLARSLGYACGLGVSPPNGLADLFDLPRHFVNMPWTLDQLAWA
jgi:peptidoglycan/xylan/chitin deacetylase (PgdA/CDA1 family)